MVEKKKTITSIDVKDWFDFTKNPENIYDKDLNFLDKSKEKDLTRKIDLHGLSLDEANKTIENFINNSFESGYKKLIIITGKGSKSKVYHDPYRSEKMSVLKYSIPEYVKKNKTLFNKIYKIEKADIKDGGGGAFYIFLKSFKKPKE